MVVLLGLSLWIWIAIITGVIGTLVTFSWYRIVPPSEAHFVTASRKVKVVSPDTTIQKEAGAAYFAIPEFIPKFGVKVRILPVTIKEINGEMETFEKDQARFMVKYSVKYRITNVQRAAETFINEQELFRMADDQVRSAVRAVTVKYTVNDARANKQKMAEESRTELNDDFEKWGLTLVMFALVDFQDTVDSKVISNISKRREVEIETDTRQQNAEKYKNARFKEAEADESAKKREIERDQVVSQREQEKIMKVAEQQKLAREKELEVTRVQEVKSQEIEKERAIVEIEQEQAVEIIRKERKRLEGEGDRQKLEEQAKGQAASTRENLFAEAEGKEKLQEALKKFDDRAILALTAEKIVEMQKVIGVEAAKAFANSDMKVFVGNQDAKSSFDFGQFLTALTVSSTSTAESLLNRLRRPNDLGINMFEPKSPVEKSSQMPKAAKA